MIAKGWQKKGLHRSTFLLSKKAMSSTVATVFLIMITVAAVSILWTVVFPFLDGQMDFDSYNVKLDILTEGGYTVYDPDSNFALIQIKRGEDEATLSGVELMIDFDGSSYKTSLRAPSAGFAKRYVFNLSKMATAGYNPGYTSVAPIFKDGDREVVGQITSNLILPYRQIARNVEELVLEVWGSEDKGDNIVIELDPDQEEEELTFICPEGEIPDSWGGCALYWEWIDEVNSQSEPPVPLLEASFSYTGEYDGDWVGDHYVRFKGTGCVLNETACGQINFGAEGPILGVEGAVFLNKTSPDICDIDWFYIYDNPICE